MNRAMPLYALEPRLLWWNVTELSIRVKPVPNLDPGWMIRLIPLKEVCTEYTPE